MQNEAYKVTCNYMKIYHIQRSHVYQSNLEKYYLIQNFHYLSYLNNIYFTYYQAIYDHNRQIEINEGS